MPLVSIVLPTWNRKDTILRAVESVRSQTFADWELLVVDDGSTDGTAELLDGLDPRVRVLRGAHAGVASARSRGLAEGRGELFAFLDSDDAWPTHHLALATAFFDAFPDEHLFSSEFWEDFGDHRFLKHFRPETGAWYPSVARGLGSDAFALVPPRGDGYLHVYDARAPVGPWAWAALADIERSEREHLFHYRGHLFRHWRWGWLLALQPTVVTREAVEAVGPFDTSYVVASDFPWLAELCRRFTCHFFSLPGTFKYELAEGRRQPAEGHLATGPSALTFHEDVLRAFETLFLSRDPADPELSALHGQRHQLAAEAALVLGDRAAASRHLAAAARCFANPDALATLLFEREAVQPALTRLLLRGALAEVEAVGAAVFDQLVPDERLAARLALGVTRGRQRVARVREALHARGAA